MKTLLAIKTHSVIDVITNSSSELFVCGKNKTLETVKEILALKHIEGIEEPWVFSLKAYREWRTMQQYRGERDWDHHFAVIEGWFFDPENEQDVKEIRKNSIEKYNSPWADRIRKAATTGIDGWKQREAEVDKIYEEIAYAEVKPDWWNKLKGDYRDSVIDLDGCVIIESEGDNSIEWEDVEWLEDTFNASRTHLG